MGRFHQDGNLGLWTSFFWSHKQWWWDHNLGLIVVSKNMFYKWMVRHPGKIEIFQNQVKISLYKRKFSLDPNYDLTITVYSIKKRTFRTQHSRPCEIDPYMSLIILVWAYEYDHMNMSMILVWIWVLWYE